MGFQPGTNNSRQSAIETAVGAKELRTIGAGTHVLQVGKGQVASGIARLGRHAEVSYAEPDYVVHADMTPNDPDYGALWGLAKIQSDLAWNLTTGSRDVVVGVVDTGVDYTHPDLVANTWSNDGTINRCPAGTHPVPEICRAC